VFKVIRDGGINLTFRRNFGNEEAQEWEDLQATNAPWRGSFISRAGFSEMVPGKIWRVFDFFTL
jgi:hypothetical protein